MSISAVTGRNEVTASAATAAPTGIAASQSLGAAGPLVLNGSLAIASATVPPSSNTVVAPPDNPGSNLASVLEPGAGWPVTGTAAIINPPQQIFVDSAGDDAGINFTISGLDNNGNPVTETFAGGNIATITSKYIYSQVNSITANGATASTVTAGTTAVVYSPWIIAGHYKKNYTANLRAFIPSGDSANFDIEATSEPGIMLEYGGYTDDLIALETAQTAAITVPLEEPYMAYRLKINSGGPVVLRLIPSTTA